MSAHIGGMDAVIETASVSIRAVSASQGFGGRTTMLEGAGVRPGLEDKAVF